MDSTQLKAEARAAWIGYIQNRIGPVSGPPSAEWQHWILLQQSLARFGPSFHGAIQACHKIGPQALSQCVLALENGHQAVARQFHHTGTFFGSGS